MENIYFAFIIFIGLLAIFDLVVGVSNDAVNFLNSAIGAKVARFRTILIVASVGVFVGAVLSNGMMDIARHGIFQPQWFSFNDLLCIFLAMMVTDVVLLDVFNSLGLPTSTTVSLVFEMLGGAFMLAFLMLITDSTEAGGFGDLLNTEKALTVILGIFLSVAVAFIFGTLTQWLARLLFTFNYAPRLKWVIGIFGGVAFTAISYFVLVKGLKGSPVISAEASEWIGANTTSLMGGMFVVSAIVMQILHICRINVFKIIVLLGTFALAMAFASNDLVNFIGVPLAALSAYQDFSSVPGADAATYMMGSLNESATTPVVYLFIAGVIMVLALVFSKKAHNVIKTSVDLSRQDEGEEMFGSSRAARSIVRGANNVGDFIDKVVPKSVFRWMDTRFNKDEAIMAPGAAFDLVRASVNLVLAALLISLGTSLKLPLSTTYVTFIVAMGTSLADRAWTRESAVFRITGVLNVIGGWFLTAGVAFTACALVTLCMYYGGMIVMVAFVVIAVALLVRSHVSFGKKEGEEEQDILFREMMATKDKEESWKLLRRHVALTQQDVLDQLWHNYEEVVDGFIDEDLTRLRVSLRNLNALRARKKKLRQRQLVGMRRIDRQLSLEKNTWFHLGSNSGDQMFYCLKRLGEPCCEHVDNNFNPLPKQLVEELLPVKKQVVDFIVRSQRLLIDEDYANLDALLEEEEVFKDSISVLRKQQIDRMQDDVQTGLKVQLVYLNILQESQLLLSELRHYLRAYRRFQM